jgi:hypothetical protein
MPQRRGHSRQAERGANLQKTVFAFFKHIILALWCKAIENRRTVLHFFDFFFENGFFQKSPYVWGIWVLLELVATAAAPVFWGVPSDRAAKKHAKLIEQSYVYQSLLPFSGFCAGPISK